MHKIKFLVLSFLFVLFCASEIFAEEITFSADKMTGSSNSQKGVTLLEGNAVVKAGTMEIRGDKIEITGKNYRNLIATGNVSGNDAEKGFYFTTKTLKYDRELDYAILDGNSVMEDTDNDVTAKAGMITYNRKNETAILQVNVRILRKNIACRSAFAVYKRSENSLVLTGSPVVVRDSDQFRAARITVLLDTEEISLEGRVSGSMTQKEEEQASLQEKKENSKTLKEENSSVSEEKADSTDTMEEEEEENDESEEILEESASNEVLPNYDTEPKSDKKETAFAEETVWLNKKRNPNGNTYTAS